MNPRPTRSPLAGALAGLLLLGARASAAEPLAYSMRLSQLEGRWALLPPRPPLVSQPFGFVYVDPEAGFTLDLGGLLRIGADGKWVREPVVVEDRARVVIRIDARNNLLAAPLPQVAIAQLGLPEQPEAIAFYRDTSDPLTHRIRWGRHLNHVGDCARALEYLEPAWKEKPEAKGLAFELAYAYNELKRTDDALAVLEAAVARDPDDLLLGGELAYAYQSSGKTEAAVALYLKLIPRCGEDRLQVKSEYAYNLAAAYAKLGDDENTRTWRANAKAWAPKGTPLWDHLNR